jgi:hypothetical protein
MTSEGESDVEDARTPIINQQPADVVDLGGVDIYADNGWDTDLEEEPGRPSRTAIWMVCGMSRLQSALRHVTWGGG